MTDNDKDDIRSGSTEFKTVKAGCGIRFDPETLDNESGFDFSMAEKLKADNKDTTTTPEQKENNTSK